MTIGGRSFHQSLSTRDEAGLTPPAPGGDFGNLFFSHGRTIDSMNAAAPLSEMLSAIVLFTRGPSGEASAKRVVGGRRIERDFWGEVSRHLTTVAESSARRVLVVSPEELHLGDEWLPQLGSTFFERLRNAETAARAQVAGSVAILACDIPDVTERQFAAASTLLRSRQRRVVLGPSPDGGIYFIAANEAVIHRLESVRWFSSHVAGDIAAILAREGFEICWLEMLADIDSSEDLARQFASFSYLTTTTHRTIRRFLVVWRLHESPSYPTESASVVPQLRAPPAPRLPAL
jgi:2-phospho-L-lactate guanylyltransferase (CobY/MobA/RfbA family)